MPLKPTKRELEIAKSTWEPNTFYTIACALASYREELAKQTIRATKCIVTCPECDYTWGHGFLDDSMATAILNHGKDNE